MKLLQIRFIFSFPFTEPEDIFYGGKNQITDQAIGLIEANIYMYEELLEVLKPQANSPNPFEKLLKDF
jgi:hypothetical protein